VSRGGAQQGGEGLGLGEGRKFVAEGEIAVVERGLQLFQEQAAK
jgi:hypothetical protein